MKITITAHEVFNGRDLKITVPLEHFENQEINLNENCEDFRLAMIRQEMSKQLSLIKKSK